MPHSEATRSKRGREGRSKLKTRPHGKLDARYTVGLPREIANQVQQYAQTVDASMSKAIASLVRLGLENQQSRKREFFKSLKQNLANDDPKQEDVLVDQFRALILGR